MEKTVVLPKYKVQMDIVNMAYNADSMVGEFIKEARKQGWTKEQIDLVTNEVFNGDQNNMLQTLLKYAEQEDIID